MKQKKALQAALKKVKLLPPEEYNHATLACILLRVWAGNYKCDKTLREMGIKNPSIEAIVRLRTYNSETNKQSPESNAILIDCLRYLFAELNKKIDKYGINQLPPWYRDFLKKGEVILPKKKDDRLSFAKDFG